MTLLSKIRTAINDHKARKARNEHLAAIHSQIHTQRASHGRTRHLHAKAYDYTHKTLQGSIRMDERKQLPGLREMLRRD